MGGSSKLSKEKKFMSQEPVGRQQASKASVSTGYRVDADGEMANPEAVEARLAKRTAYTPKMLTYDEMLASLIQNGKSNGSR